MLFHIHIPKTAGTSLTEVFAQMFGDDYQCHGLTSENPTTAKPFASAHRTYLQARRIFPRRKYCTIVRDPDKRLRSTIEHVYARRKLPAYKSLASCLVPLVESDFRIPDGALENTHFLTAVDNVLIRYITSVPVKGLVEREHLDSAIYNIKNIHFIGSIENLSEVVKNIAHAYGKAMPDVPVLNKGLINSHVYRETPERLHRFSFFDRILYKEISGVMSPQG